MTIFAQSSFDFENRDLSSWIQNPAFHWGVSSEGALKGSYSLHHLMDNSFASVDYIYYKQEYANLDDTLDIVFRIRHAYAPSSSNNWQFFCLASASEAKESSLLIREGIFFGVNFHSSDDTMRIWQVYEGESLEICTTPINYQEDIGTGEVPLFQILRFPDGRWEIHCSPEGSENKLALQSSGKEHFKVRGKYLGFRYSYTSAQDRKLWIDDIRVKGKFYQDRTAPRVENIAIQQINQLNISFNERIQKLLCSNFTIQDIGIDSLKSADKSVLLYLDRPLANRKKYLLRVSGISDQDNNLLEDTIIGVRMDMPEFGEIVINELMPKPFPPVYLPECEYVELYNKSANDVSLKGWKLSINSRTYAFPDTFLRAESYVLLASGYCFPDTIGQLVVFNSASVLANNGGTLELRDQFGRLIHFFEYGELERYGPLKGEGGWSLELVDPENTCHGKDNILYSQDWHGGTPGYLNSNVNKNIDPDPADYLYYGIDTMGLSLHFNEAINISKLRIDHFNALAISPGGFQTGYDSICSRVLINYFDFTDSHQGLVIKSIKDCAGNLSADIDLRVMMPEQPGSLVPLINEIMFDPVEDELEYIELFHPGKEAIDLKDIKIGVARDRDEIDAAFFLSDESHIMLPESYILLCRNEDSVREFWNLPGKMDIVELENWKNLGNSIGYIRLSDRSDRLIDELSYDENMHSELLGDTRGVSLERISIEACKIPGNCWESAAASASYATPGMENSQLILPEDHEDKLSLSPRVFSPDMDGFEDVLTIEIACSNNERLLSVFITDLDGRMINNLLSRGLSSEFNRLYWDGKGDDGHLVVPGFYVIHTLIYSNEGEFRLRKACAVKYRYDY